MITDRALNTAQLSLPEKYTQVTIVPYSFRCYQSAVFSSQVSQISLDLTDLYFEIEDAATGAIDIINKNGGFTVTSCYKRGKVTDRTILHQNKKQ